MSQYEEWLERELDLLEAHYDGEFDREEAKARIEGTLIANQQRLASAVQELLEKDPIYRAIRRLARYIDRKIRA